MSSCFGLLGSALLLSALSSVTPSDRFALADRLFNRGEYALAKTEYLSLNGAREIPGDELGYRLGECERMLGNTNAAVSIYRKMLKEHPQSRLVPRARLQLAMASSGDDRIGLLRMLDSDSVEPGIRAAALYRLGVETKDADCLARSVVADPKGAYSGYARLERASLLAKSDKIEDRRTAVTQCLEVAFGDNGELAQYALYLAAAASVSAGRTDDAASLFHRYLKKYPNGGYVNSARSQCAACEYSAGRYNEVLALCGDSRGTDDLEYWRIVANYQLGRSKETAALSKRYLEDFPMGRYRKQVDEVMLRMECAEAERAGDFVRMAECAGSLVSRRGIASDRLRLAWAYERSGKTNEASRAYVEVAVKNPGTAESAEAMFRKGCLDFNALDWSAAEMSFKEALSGKLEKRWIATARYLRGICACRLSHSEEGVAMLRKALELGLPIEEDREARLSIADVDYNSGRTNDAVVAYCRLVREGATVRMSAAKIASVGAVLPPAERKICAQALTKSDSAEWRQTGYAMIGNAEKECGSMQAAIAAWEKCVAEKCETRAMAGILVDLGRARLKSGNAAGAEQCLKKAVEMNANDSAVRAEAYLALAESAVARSDRESARGYATVVTELFDTSPCAEEARKLLKTLGAGDGRNKK